VNRQQGIKIKKNKYHIKLQSKDEN
jgi:hypothetical protein